MSEPRRAPRQQPLLVPLHQLPLLRLQEAAEYLRMARSTFRRSLALTIPHVKILSERRWHREELDRYVAEHRAVGPAKAAQGAEHAG